MSESDDVTTMDSGLWKVPLSEVVKIKSVADRHWSPENQSYARYIANQGAEYVKWRQTGGQPPDYLARHASMKRN